MNPTTERIAKIVITTTSSMRVKPFFLCTRERKKYFSTIILIFFIYRENKNNVKDTISIPSISDFQNQKFDRPALSAIMLALMINEIFMKYFSPHFRRIFFGIFLFLFGGILVTFAFDIVDTNFTPQSATTSGSNNNQIWFSTG